MAACDLEKKVLLPLQVVGGQPWWAAFCAEASWLDNEGSEIIQKYLELFNCLGAIATFLLHGGEIFD